MGPRFDETTSEGKSYEVDESEGGGVSASFDHTHAEKSRKSYV